MTINISNCEWRACCRFLHNTGIKAGYSNP